MGRKDVMNPQAAEDKVGLYPARGVIEDSVHGFIPLNEAEYRLLQTPFLRRLHNIKQLGMAFLVFPSARHSRLEHSLGAMHISYLMAQKVVREAAKDGRICGELFTKCEEGPFNNFVQLSRLVGLLHDIGHLAYSHMTEEAVAQAIRYGPEDALRVFNDVAGRGGKLHEAYGDAFLKELIRAVGEDAEASRFAGLEQLLENARAALSAKEECDEGLAGELGLTCGAVRLAHEIISNEIADADRLDYLLRDAQATGIVYGNVDLERLVHGLKLNVVEGRVTLGLDVKSLHTLEDVFDARYKMYRSVYFHHKIVAISKAVSHFIRSLANEWDGAAFPLYRDARSFYDVVNPRSLAAAIRGDLYYFDDPELDMMTKICAKGGSGFRLAARWAKSLLDRRDLLPLSLMKRSEELVMTIASLLGESGAAGRPMSSVINEVFTHIEVNVPEIVKRLSSIVGDDVEVETFRGSIIDVGTMGDSRLSVFRWQESPYLRGLILQGYSPVMLLYAYSDSEDVHRKIRHHAEELREATRSMLVELVKEGLASAKA